MASANKNNVAVLGLGIIGSRVAENLRKAGSIPLCEPLCGAARRAPCRTSSPVRAPARQGHKNLGSNNTGDLYVHVQIAVPSKLSAEQTEKLKEFAALMGERGTEVEESFFEKAKRFFR